MRPFLSVFVWALAILALPVSAGSAQTQPVSAAAGMLPARYPDAELSGNITSADHQTYQHIPFTMPEGVDRLVVAFDYDGREQKTVIDLGIEDPHGFRGASGGNKAHFTIARSDATPSYLPGPLDPGEWALSLGVPNVRQGVVSAWHARLWFLKGAEAQMLPAPTKGRGPGWYRGDLHLHTGQSDGSCDSQSGRRVPCPLFRTLERAATQGLDFVAVTEHNTSSHANGLYEAQPYFDQMLLIPGREITTFFGHFNIFGVTEPLDFQILPNSETSFNSIADRVHRLGGLVSINHPALPSGEICMGCGWTMGDPSFVHPVDYTKVDAVEVINGSATASADSDAEGIVSGISFWVEQLENGFALAAVGGSDNHDPDREGLGSIAAPVTVVEAADLTASALFDGIRNGRSFVVIDPSIAPLHLDFSLDAGGEVVRMGGEARLAEGDTITLIPDIAAPANSVVEVYDGEERQLETFVSPEGDGLTFTLDSAGVHAIHLRIRSAEGNLVALGSAVRVTVMSPD